MSADAPALPPAEEQPKSLADKVGAALPVALTAIATAFAGMSTSEMSFAMYWRSAAAQDQAKANDQWSLAGFKRDRSLIVQTTAAQLRAASGYRNPPLSAADDEPTRWLRGQGPPRVTLPAIDDAPIEALLEADRAKRPEPEVLALAGARKVDRGRLDEVVYAAEAEVARVDREWDPVLKRIDQMVSQAAAAAGTAGGDARADATALQAARFEVESRRYRAEAYLNQQVGYLYEARVKTSTAESDRHRARSKNFFYAMLAGQVGATLASLGLARKQRSVLWAVAGLAGVVAVTFGVYVYLGM